MLMVASVGNEQAHFVQDGRNVKNDSESRVKLVLLLQAAEQLPAQVGDLHRMGLVKVVFSAQLNGGADDLVDERLVPLPAMSELLQQAVAQVDIRDEDVIELRRL